MIVPVRLFAAVRQLIGSETVAVELPEAATVAALRERLREEYPAAASLLSRSLFAINQDYAADETTLPTGADVACIPPVSGG